ncbi:hypothetical protein A6F68_02694 [Tsuneonella dongtanensis]|uniref:Uncharacterized protein n=1 Tax=Tsuneonella dongtanensis TaxID=692370 RepID=A0A1B2AGC5_9SPHN|nr:hypothetical protein [Tsuneonella dongtanensis]ANY21186.1 hypothetical protein A6F68_02694 [Tsuneonella dongtanensis]
MQQDEKIALCSLAIDRRAALKATYNAIPIECHPHQLIERNGTVYLRAFNPAKSRLETDDAALGMFHLGGLSDLSLCGYAFEPLPPAAASTQRSDDKVLVSL